MSVSLQSKIFTVLHEYMQDDQQSTQNRALAREAVAEWIYAFVIDCDVLSMLMTCNLDLETKEECADCWIVQAATAALWMRGAVWVFYFDFGGFRVLSPSSLSTITPAHNLACLCPSSHHRGSHGRHDCHVLQCKRATRDWSVGKMLARTVFLLRTLNSAP